MTTAQEEVEQAGGNALLHIGGVVGDSKLGEICSHHQLFVDNAVDDLLDWQAGVHLLNLCQFPFGDGDFQNCVIKNC